MQELPNHPAAGKAGLALCWQSNVTGPACLSRVVKRRAMRAIFITASVCSVASLVA
jgi:hypothetical protein